MKSNFVHPHSHLVPLKEIPRAQRVLLYSRYGTPYMDNEVAERTHQGTGIPAKPYIAAARHRHLPTRTKACGETHRE